MAEQQEQTAPGARPPRNAMDRFIDGIELIAAFFAGLVALDIFVSVLLRYFFAVQIPTAMISAAFCSAS